MAGFNQKRYRITAAVTAVVLIFAIGIGSLAATGKLGSLSQAVSSLFQSSGGKHEPTTAVPMTTEPTSRPADDDVSATFERAETMRGVWLTAGTDYLTTSAETYAQTTAKLKDLFNRMVGYGMNTVIVPLQYGQKVIYKGHSTLSSVYTGKDEDLLAFILEKASERGIFVYVLYSLQGDGSDPFTDDGSRAILSNVQQLCKSYDFNGILFDDYAFVKSEAGYQSYLQNGGGKSYDDFKVDGVMSLCNRAVSAAKQASGGIYAGIAADAVWAKKNNIGAGVDSTGYVYESLIDGFADTRMMVKKGIVDFVLVKNYGSMQYAPAQFDKVAAWWADVAKDTESSLYFSLAASRVASGGEEDAGWKQADQLVKQLKALESVTYSGECYDSLAALIADTTGSTQVLTQYYEGRDTGSDGLVLKDLSLTSPSKTVFTSYEGKFSLIGASDPNFPLKLNGKEVERTALGYFSLECQLSIGTNKFELEHKGELTTLIVTHKVVLLKEVLPSTNQTLEGGTQVMISAVARKGAQVTAKLGGSTIPLKETTLNDEDANVSTSDFVHYSGTFTMPAETSSVQDLGKITVTATYLGTVETMAGGAFRVNAKQNETTVATTTTTSHQTTKPTSGSGSPGGTTGEKHDVLDITGTVSAGSKSIAQVVVDQAEMLKGGNTIDDKSRPIYNYLPKGTLDYCGANDIINYSYSPPIHYRLLNSGQRLYVNTSGKGNNIKVLKGTLPSTNSVTARSVSVSDRHTVITFDLHWKAPFLVEYLPQSYPNGSASNPTYEISKATFQYIDITFYYAVSGQGKLDLSGNPLFKSAQWIAPSGSGKHYKLRLYLQKTGAFYGFTANFNEYGQLVFQFLNPADISKASNSYGYSLKGVTIVVDAGHGGSDPGAMGANKNYSEAKLNLTLAKMVRDELESIGAKVVMTRETDKDVSLEQRVVITRKALPDAFISIHRNAADSTSAKGYSDYYYYPFSKALAQSVYDTASKSFTKRGVNYYPFYVTRITECPAILTENGFVTNASEHETIIKDSFNKAHAKQIVQGIVNYFKNL